MSKSSIASLMEEFEGQRAKTGQKLVSGIGVSNEAHKALITLHHNSPKVSNSLLAKPPKGKKGVVKTTIPVYRGWRPDQVSFYGWKNAKVGDKLTFDAPMAFSYTFVASKAFGISHGGIKTKVNLPVEQVLMTDRLNAATSGLSHEDELIFLGEPVTLEVTAVA